MDKTPTDVRVSETDDDAPNREKDQKLELLRHRILDLDGYGLTKMTLKLRHAGGSFKAQDL